MNNIGMANMKAITDRPHDTSSHFQENYNKRTQLNTYIYEYFLHNGMFQCAESILKADSDIKVHRHSPGSAPDVKGRRLKKNHRNKITDTGLDSTPSSLLPAPNVPNLSPDSCFLYEWFCLFWAMFNAQKNKVGRLEAYQHACHIQNLSRPQTRSSSRLLQAPGSATHNAFYTSNETGVGSITPWVIGSQTGGRSNEALQRFQMQLTSMEQQNKSELTTRQGRSGLSRNDDIAGGGGSQGPIRSSKPLQRPALQAPAPDALPDTTKQVKIGIQPMNDIILNLPKASVDCLGGSVGMVRMNDWMRASDSRTYQQSNGQSTGQSVAAKETLFQQQGKTGHNWWVQWQNDSNKSPIPWTSRPGVQGTQQERSLPSSVKPGDANISAKPRSTIPSPLRTSKSALPTPQLSKAARKKGLSPKRMTPKRRTMNVKDEMVTCKIPRLNVGSTVTHPANAAPNPAPHINPVGMRKNAQNTSLAQAVPTGQPSAALPLTPAFTAANPPVDLVQSMTFGIEISNDFASLPTRNSDLHDFDIDAFLESSATDVDFHLNYLPLDIDDDGMDQK